MIKCISKKIIIIKILIYKIKKRNEVFFNKFSLKHGKGYGNRCAENPNSPFVHGILRDITDISNFKRFFKERKGLAKRTSQH